MRKQANQGNGRADHKHMLGINRVHLPEMEQRGQNRGDKQPHRHQIIGLFGKDNALLAMWAGKRLAVYKGFQLAVQAQQALVHRFLAVGAAQGFDQQGHSLFESEVALKGEGYCLWAPQAMADDLNHCCGMGDHIGYGPESMKEI